MVTGNRHVLAGTLRGIGFYPERKEAGSRLTFPHRAVRKRVPSPGVRRGPGMHVVAGGVPVHTWPVLRGPGFLLVLGNDPEKGTGIPKRSVPYLLSVSRYFQMTLIVTRTGQERVSVFCKY